MMATRYTVVVMPGPRVTVRGTVPSLEPEDDPGIHGSNRPTASSGSMDCRVKPGNDNGGVGVGHRLIGPEPWP
jgi:hypothetical protein